MRKVAFFFGFMFLAGFVLMLFDGMVYAFAFGDATNPWLPVIDLPWHAYEQSKAPTWPTADFRFRSRIEIILAIVSLMVTVFCFWRAHRIKVRRRNADEAMQAARQRRRERAIQAQAVQTQEAFLWSSNPEWPAPQPEQRRE